MPHHKSAAKRVITNEKARQRNVALRSRMRLALKTVREGGRAKQFEEQQHREARGTSTNHGGRD